MLCPLHAPAVVPHSVPTINQNLARYNTTVRLERQVVVPMALARATIPHTRITSVMVDPDRRLPQPSNARISLTKTAGSPSLSSSPRPARRSHREDVPGFRTPVAHLQCVDTVESRHSRIVGLKGGSLVNIARIAIDTLTMTDDLVVVARADLSPDRHSSVIEVATVEIKDLKNSDHVGQGLVLILPIVVTGRLGSAEDHPLLTGTDNPSGTTNHAPLILQVETEVPEGSPCQISPFCWQKLAMVGNQRATSTAKIVAM